MYRTFFQYTKSLSTPLFFPQQVKAHLILQTHVKVGYFSCGLANKMAAETSVAGNLDPWRGVEVQDLEGQEIRLASRWAENVAVVILVRRFG